MRWASERGQTTTEYLMISGFITGVAMFVLSVMGVPFRQVLQVLVACLINEVCS
jgi:hypothetical protein